MKKNKAFTLIELTAVLVILAIISLIVAPLILNIIRRVKDVANKRSVDGYGRAVEYAMANYQLKHLRYPDSFDELEIEYKGNKVECVTSRINPDYSIYLSGCKVNGRLVNDDREFDGYYHYGILKMTNQEYVDTYGKNLEDAIKAYHDEHNEYPSDYTTLTLAPLDKEVSCDVDINQDGTVHLTNCKVDNEEVIDNNNEAYVYGNLYATSSLLKKSNSKSITTYTDGNTHEMYTFDHEATSQTPALTDYRYIGNEPYNYVTFNNELWRIIGVFTVDDGKNNQENRIKLVKNEKISSNMAWSSANCNDWTSASLKTYLNGSYYDEISSSSQELFKPSVFYLGGSTLQTGAAETYYSWERGIAVVSGRKSNWLGSIALMYPSDFVYTYALNVDNKCYTDGNGCSSGVPSNGWIYNANSNMIDWLLSPNISSGLTAYTLGNTGYVGHYNFVNIARAIRPVLYLKPEVRIKSGNGSIDNPYEFEL